MQQVYPLRKLKNSLPFIPSFHDWLNLMAGIRLSPPQDVHIPEHLQVYSYFAIFRNITELAESKQSHGNSKTCRRGYTHWLFWERCKGIKFQISISEIYISKIYLSKPENHLWFLTIWFGLVLRRWFGFGFFETIFSKPYHTVCTIIIIYLQRWFSEMVLNHRNSFHLSKDTGVIFIVFDEHILTYVKGNNNAVLQMALSAA